VPGDYFGEEALVADTIRNATVRMAATAWSAGSIAPSSTRSSSPRWCRPSISRRRSASWPARESVSTSSTCAFRPNTSCGHIEGSSNIPVVALRKRLRELDRNRTCLVTPDGGRRSELAVYLLRQAGLNAYLLNG
jgi:hypothetical protein